MITVENLEKTFTIAKKNQGILGTLKSVFKNDSEILTAVDNISFHVKEGEIVGYIGTNGAGKSTTIKMLCGILTPSNGNITVNGIIPYINRKENAKNIGVVFGQRSQLWWDIAVEESFLILKEIYGISKVDFNKRFRELDEILELSRFLRNPVRTLSLGQRMRADLAAALLHNPKVLFLDEPTIGMDILVKEQVRHAIKKMNKDYNTTIVLTTHDMEDISELSSKIIMIDRGKIIYNGEKSEIINNYNKNYTLKVKYTSNTSNFENMINEIKNISNSVNITHDEIHINYAKKNRLNNILNILSNKVVIEEVNVEKVSLDDIVKSFLMGGS